MNNAEKYDKVFMETFSIDKSKLNANLSFKSIPFWDSVGHITLIAAMEEAFGIELDPDDVMVFESYEKGKEILKKYGTNF